MTEPISPETIIDEDDAQDAPPVEPETDEDDDAADAAEDDNAAQSEPAEASSTSPEEWERRFKTIAARYKTYLAAVQRTLDDDAKDLLPCPLCADGIPSLVNAHDAGHVADEVQDAVQTFLGYTAPSQLRQSRLNEPCGTCGGLGELLTGSRVPAHLTKVCPDCLGFGFTGPGNTMHVTTTGTATTTEPNGAPNTVDISAALAAMNSPVPS